MREMEHTILLDKTIYNREVLLKTAFMQTDNFYIHLSQDNNNWIVVLKGKTAEVMECSFENELIRQQCQYDLLIESREIRKILLARAMASTIIDEPVSQGQEDTGTASFDMSGIMKGWYENHE